MTDLMTIRETRAAVKAASAVYVCPQFGVCERWVKISKTEAMQMLKRVEGTPHDNEMYAGRFGVERFGEVYLG